MPSTMHLLREILMEGQARTQAEIQEALEKRGSSVSQSKVSRLLHQVGAVKLIDKEGKTHYRMPHETGLIHELSSTHEKTIFRQWVLDVDANETLIIIHTTPGAAAMVARILDQHRVHLGLLGTIAGDDTIFIATKSHALVADVVQLIQELFDL